jgi:hypothetical protein
VALWFRDYSTGTEHCQNWGMCSRPGDYGSSTLTWMNRITICVTHIPCSCLTHTSLAPTCFGYILQPSSERHNVTKNTVSPW